MNSTRHAVVLLTMALVLGSCAGDSSENGDELLVVATTTVLGDVVQNIVGDEARVEVLTPIGADPHDFQASARQVATVNQADLVVSNGLGLEESLEDVLAGAAADGVEVFEVGPLLDPIPFGDTAHAEDHPEEDHEHEGDDPHVWMDPLRMAEAARLIAARLSEVAPGSDWNERAEDYAARLEAADSDIFQTLSSIPEENRKLVTNHASLGYFADRYGFEVIGVVIPGGSTLGDPSSEELAQLVEVMRNERATALFGETTGTGALAEAVASELGEDVRVVELFTGSLGEPGSGAETLIEMLTTDAERIAEALSG